MPARPDTATIAGRVIVSGASGFIGSALVRVLRGRGREVFCLVRREAVGSQEIRWDPTAGVIDARHFEGASAVVNLAGASIARRWTDGARREIRRSRVEGTDVLARAIAACSKPPRVLVNGSAIGIYGDRHDEEIDESSASGEGFLASICKDWERATAPASNAGIRVVHARTGIVLGKGGGLLATVGPAFRAGLGARIGSGQQWMSWIALTDIIRAISWAIDTEALAGPVNLVAPNPVRNAEFTRTLALALGRPAFLAVPGRALALLLGTMAEETALAGQRVRPRRLNESGFGFETPTLEGALRAELAARKSER